MKGAYSSIDRDIFQHQTVGIAEEMSRSLRRTAYSSIIWDAYDYACAVFTERGEMLAQAKSIPSQLGIMSTALAKMLERVPAAQWKPGDIFICNDPYLGCTHTPDITLFSPVFYDDSSSPSPRPSPTTSTSAGRCRARRPSTISRYSERG